jgi:glycosyltransferase involved in cell wall biosynthesis
MRIISVYRHPDVMAGSERAMHVTARALKAKGHQVYLLHGMDDMPRTAVDYDGHLGLPVLFDQKSKLRPAGLLDAEKQIDQFVAQRGIDLIHFHGFPRCESLRRLVDKHTTVVTTHCPLCPNGSRYMWKDRKACDRQIGVACFTQGYLHKGCGYLGNQEPQSTLGFARSMLSDAARRDAIARSTRVIVPSKWMKNRLSADGIPEAIIRVIRNAFFAPQNPPDVAVTTESPAVLFVGRLVDFKGPDHLLRASSLISTPHRVWFVGDGPMRAKLEELARELRLLDRTCFWGEMEPEAINALRQQSSVVVVPSLWQDNFPNVGPEAMLMRRPVVGYAVGGISEWLKDEITGKLVSPGNIEGLAQAIEYILKNPEAARQMGEAGHEVASQWTLDAHAEGLLSVYEEAVQANG